MAGKTKLKQPKYQSREGVRNHVMAYYKPEFKELIVKKYLAGADKKSLAIEGFVA